MVTKREKIEYYGLKISVEPSEEKPFYLTGESPLFKVIIENESSNRRYGKIAIRWRLAELQTHRVVAFNVNPFENQRLELVREWLYREGTVVYELLVMAKPPENYVDIPNLEVFREYYNTGIQSMHPLCSYHVKDKDLYKYEEDHRNAMKRFSFVTVGLTIVNVILVICRFLLAFNYVKKKPKRHSFPCRS